MGTTKNSDGKVLHSSGRAINFSFEEMNSWEIGLVHLMKYSTEHRAILLINLFINRLGNGWMYPLLVSLVFLFYGIDAWSILLISILSAGLAHLIYPKIKNLLKRQRPHEFDPSLTIPIEPLDQYSCPSGHSMTLVAVTIPLLFLSYELWLAILVWWLLIAWSRLSLGHHYLSDIIFGSLIGAMAALPWVFLLQYINN